MKTDIHPKYYEKATVKCSCGATHTLGSTKEKMTVEICSKCHPFYTGKEKLVDTAGRVERFQARKKAAEAKRTVTVDKKQATKKTKTAEKKTTAKSKPTAKKKTPAKAASKKSKK